MKYHGNAIGNPLDEPLHTIDGTDRYALVKVFVETSPGVREPAILLNVPGVGPCLVADIHLRMLTPRELARCQGFPDSYILTGSNANQVARIGNSVPPPLIEALVRANYKPARRAKK
jgi:DNA (cytosine-5)-methyltransferase 1